MKKERNINLDIIRCIAVLTVVCVHFFLNNGFYNVTVLGKKMYVATIMRTAFMVCVPLFLLLTGYLMNKKTLSRKYYSGIKKTLAVYLMTSFFILAYKIFIKNENMSPAECIINITSFRQYAWYISMYIGLFLLIPFLNLMYNNLKDKKQKLVLIVTLLFMTVLPSASNIFGVLIVPEWWVGIYPLTYYFLGAFIREYKNKLKLSLWLNFILIIVGFVFFGTYTYFLTYNKKFVLGAWCEWYSLANITNSVLVFLFLLRIKTDKIPDFVKKIIIKISEISLGIYLASWIFDDCFYPKLNEAIPEMTDRRPYFFVMVPLVFICSSVLSYIVNLMYKIIVLTINKITKKGKE